MTHETDEENRVKLEQVVKDLQIILLEHLGRANRSRSAYHSRRVKAARNRHQGDVSAIIDASGANVANYSPRFNRTEKGEPARHVMLKIKSTFIKLHGMGSVLVNTVTDREEQGTNLTVERIMLAVEHSLKNLKEDGIYKLRNLYIQLDNVVSNKCATVFSALASLVKLGVCRKVKVNYLIVGHTHEDTDALIGTIVAKLRAQDLPSLSVYAAQVKSSVRLECAQIQDVKHVIGIPDYDEIFKNCIPKTVSGILRIKELRITAAEDGQIQMYYKSNSVKEGWYPKPLDDFAKPDVWERLFPHPDGRRILSVEQACPVRDHGRRQYWEYQVKYSGESSRMFQLKCISIPCDLGSSGELRQRIGECPRQQFSKSISEQQQRDAVLEKIRLLLRARRLEDEHMPEWEKYFSDMTAIIDKRDSCSATCA